MMDPQEYQESMAAWFQHMHEVNDWPHPSAFKEIHAEHRPAYSLPVATRTDEEATKIVEENLKDCTLIGPDAGAELRKLVYGF